MHYITIVIFCSRFRVAAAAQIKDGELK